MVGIIKVVDINPRGWYMLAYLIGVDKPGGVWKLNFRDQKLILKKKTDDSIDEKWQQTDNSLCIFYILCDILIYAVFPHILIRLNASVLNFRIIFIVLYVVHDYQNYIKEFFFFLCPYTSRPPCWLRL